MSPASAYNSGCCIFNSLISINNTEKLCPVIAIRKGKYRITPYRHCYTILSSDSGSNRNKKGRAVSNVKQNMEKEKTGRPVISKPFITGLLLFGHKKAAL